MNHVGEYFTFPFIISIKCWYIRPYINRPFVNQNCCCVIPSGCWHRWFWILTFSSLSTSFPAKFIKHKGVYGKGSSGGLFPFQRNTRSAREVVAMSIPLIIGEASKLQVKYWDPLQVLKLLPNDTYTVVSVPRYGRHIFSNTVHVS